MCNWRRTPGIFFSSSDRWGGGGAHRGGGQRSLRIYNIIYNNMYTAAAIQALVYYYIDVYTFYYIHPRLRNYTFARRR